MTASLRRTVPAASLSLLARNGNRYARPLKNRRRRQSTHPHYRLRRCVGGAALSVGSHPIATGDIPPPKPATDHPSADALGLVPAYAGFGGAPLSPIWRLVVPVGTRSTPVLA